jgi:transposase
MADTATSGFAPLKGFVMGLQKDYAAVKAGLTEAWSNGQTEAHVQRLKLLKRSMYGRASFALLRKRVLYRAPDMPQRSKDVPADSDQRTAQS